MMDRSGVLSGGRISNLTSERVSRAGAREVTATVTVPSMDTGDMLSMETARTATEQRRERSIDNGGMECRVKNNSVRAPNGA